MSLQPALPFSGRTPISRQHSAEAAQSAAETRATKSLLYLRALREAGDMGLDDHTAARLLGLPLSSICSIRNGCGALVTARTDAYGVSPYGKKVTLWVRT